MKLEVILESARVEIPSSCATLKDWKYSVEVVEATCLNFEISSFSDGKN
jgi:hypothetical protein